MDRNGKELMSIWNFFVLALVGVVIATGVWVFYSADFNIRQNEATAMNDRIYDCFTENGFLKSEVLDDDFDILNSCSFNDVFKGNEVFVEVSFEYSDGIKARNKNIIAGNSVLGDDCEISENSENKVQCISKTENILTKDLKEIKMQILTASKLSGERIK